jgi:hypothetical protein
MVEYIKKMGHSAQFERLDFNSYCPLIWALTKDANKHLLDANKEALLE